MYYFNAEGISECGIELSRKKYELQDCVARIDSLLSELSELKEERETRDQLKSARSKINDEISRIDRLEYTLSYAASAYSDSDRTGTNIASGNRRQVHLLVNRVLSENYGNADIHLAVNIVMN